MSEDRVKIVYHPDFLSSTSPVLPLEYLDFVRGCHLGIFPSCYEPWGYAPAECTLCGIPSITTNLTGFASYISAHIPDPEENGLYIIDRANKNRRECTEELVDCLYRFCMQDRRQRVEQRNKTERLSNILSWDSMYKHYVDARNKALKAQYGFELPVPSFLPKDDEEI